MESRTTIPCQGAEPLIRRPRPAWRRLALRVHVARRDVSASRARRVVLLVVYLWVANLFDLSFTILADRIGRFTELNPVASVFLANPAALAVFKVSLLVFSTVVFLVCRRRLLAEVGCWCLCAIYTALSFIWMEYYLLGW
jgi:hypothetical protein